jgi:phosphopantothenoylcysteine decarboxylase/phosphopantothenate--cysteine ligase
MLTGKKILLGITGSIAAYKAILLVRLLVKAGAEVKVIVTPAAVNFVSPLTLSTLSKNKVLIELMEENTWANHVELGRWADVFVIAPLSCNTLSKLANGGCDNLLTAVYLSATCPVVVAPAMDEDMWHHAAIKKNIETIISYDNKIIAVESGELASGLYGEGRMAEPETIVTYLIENFFRSNELKGKKILITAGPTYEAIDPVRFIGNYSSGKMGFALAEQAYLQGADVTLVTGQTNEKTVYKNINVIDITSSDEMLDACIKNDDADVIIMSAAVADYKPLQVENKKIKKKENSWNLELTKTKDILQYLGEHKKENQFIAGFALETNNEKENALQKLDKKNLDCIILNSANTKPFGSNTNSITILSKEEELQFDEKPKQEVAKEILKYIITKQKMVYAN